MSITLADKLSVLPGPQQIVGAGTFISNLVKSIIDIAKICFGYNKKIDNEISKFKQDFVPVFPGKDKKEGLNKLPSIEKLALKKSNLPQHLKYMGVGIIR